MCAMPCDTCLRSFFLNVFFLPFFSGVAGAPPAAAGFAIKFRPWSFVVGRWLNPNDQRCLLCLGCLFLGRDRSLARALAGTSIGVSALSADRQVAAMTISAIGTDFDEPLDVHRNFLAPIALDLAFGLNDLADTVDFIFPEVLDF